MNFPVPNQPHDGRRHRSAPTASRNSHQLGGQGKTRTIVFVGIDLPKNVFAVHGVNTAGKAGRVRPNVPRAKLHELIAALPACTIGMEACSGAHHRGANRALSSGSYLGPRSTRPKPARL